MSRRAKLALSPRLNSGGHRGNPGAIRSTQDAPILTGVSAGPGLEHRIGGGTRLTAGPPTNRPRSNPATAHARGTYQRAGLTGDALDYAVILRGDPCAYCGAPADSVDHIENTAHGGALDDWENLTAACLRCNGSKQHRPLLRFLTWQDAALDDQDVARARTERRRRLLEGRS